MNRSMNEWMKEKKRMNEWMNEDLIKDGAILFQTKSELVFAQENMKQ